MTTHSEGADQPRRCKIKDRGPWVEDLRHSPRGAEILAMLGIEVDPTPRVVPRPRLERGREVAELRRQELGLPACADGPTTAEALLGTVFDDPIPALRCLVRGALDLALGDERIQGLLAAPDAVELAAAFLVHDPDPAVQRWYDTVLDAGVDAVELVLGPGCGEYGDEGVVPTWLWALVGSTEAFDHYGGVLRALGRCVVAEAVVLYAALGPVESDDGDFAEVLHGRPDWAEEGAWRIAFHDEDDPRGLTVYTPDGHAARYHCWGVDYELHHPRVDHERT